MKINISQELADKLNIFAKEDNTTIDKVITTILWQVLEKEGIE